MKKYAVGLILLISGIADAGSASGTIENILVGRSGKEMYIKISGSHNGSPCTSAHPSGYQFAIDLDNIQEAVLSAIYLAFASEKSVSVQGAGSCASFDNRLEILGYISVNK